MIQLVFIFDYHKGKNRNSRTQKNQRTVSKNRLIPIWKKLSFLTPVIGTREYRSLRILGQNSKRETLVMKLPSQ